MFILVCFIIGCNLIPTFAVQEKKMTHIHGVMEICRCKKRKKMHRPSIQSLVEVFQRRLISTFLMKIMFDKHMFIGTFFIYWKTSIINIYIAKSKM